MKEYVFTINNGDEIYFKGDKVTYISEEKTFNVFLDDKLVGFVNKEFTLYCEVKEV